MVSVRQNTCQARLTHIESPQQTSMNLWFKQGKRSGPSSRKERESEFAYPISIRSGEVPTCTNEPQLLSACSSAAQHKEGTVISTRSAIRLCRPDFSIAAATMNPPALVRTDQTLSLFTLAKTLSLAHPGYLTPLPLPTQICPINSTWWWAAHQGTERRCF